MLLAPGRPDGPAAAVRGLFVARVAHPRVAGCCGHRGPAVRPGRGGSSEGVSLAARPGRGGAGGWAALNPRGARAGACGPACPTQPHAPRTCTGRLQVHTWPRSTAHSHVQTLHQHPPSATSGSSPSSPRTLLACFFCSKCLSPDCLASNTPLLPRARPLSGALSTPGSLVSSPLALLSPSLGSQGWECEPLLLHSLFFLDVLNTIWSGP